MVKKGAKFVYLGISIWLHSTSLLALPSYPAPKLDQPISSLEQVAYGKSISENPTDCLEIEIKKRVVGIQLSGTSSGKKIFKYCSGVIVDDQTILSAGHCVAELENVRFEWLEYWWDGHYESPAVATINANDPGRFNAKDYAVYKLAKPIASVTPLKIVDVNRLAGTVKVLTAGLGGGSLRYYEGNADYVIPFLGWLFGSAPYIRNQAVNAFEGTQPGDSGAPVFIVKGCSIELLGIHSRNIHRLNASGPSIQTEEQPASEIPAEPVEKTQASPALK